MANQHISKVALLVRDYDEALSFYIDKLGFEKLEDTTLSETKRWVVIKPPASEECGLLLARAVGERQLGAVGNQTGGRVFMFLYTDNFERDFQLFKSKGVRFVRPPKMESYGKVAVFEDLYGNLWDLIQPTGSFQ